MEVLASDPDMSEQHQHITEYGKQRGVCVELASLPPNAHVDMHALARMLQRSTKSVQRAVRRGDLPAPFKFMGKCVWLAGVIVEHLKKKQEAVLR